MIHLLLETVNHKLIGKGIIFMGPEPRARALVEYPAIFALTNSVLGD
jgi:hypothetical protein